MLIGKMPLRISFAGGGTDLAEYYNKYEGFTVSFTFDKFTYVTLKERTDNKFQGFSPDFESYHPPKYFKKIKKIQGHEIVVSCLNELKLKKGVDMTFSCDVKPGSGLGASSSLAANIVNVILECKGKIWNKHKIANKAYEIGHDVLGWNIGKQDEFAAVFGGLNAFKFSKEKVSVMPIKLNRSTFNELQKNSLLFYIGKRKISSHSILNNQSTKTKSDTLTLNALHKVKEFALESYDALKQNDLTTFGTLIQKSWEEKKKFANGITNKVIDSFVKQAYILGAIGVKVTGAGGGGHLFVYIEQSKQKSLVKKFSKIGLKQLNFNYQFMGGNVVKVSEI